MKLSGRTWKFGDELGATDLVSSKYDKLGMSHKWDECAKHVLDTIDPDFVGKIQPGDLIVAGTQLGAGHAHYYMAAIMGCKHAGLGGMLAESVNTLFQRAGIDEGYPIWALPGIGTLVNDGDHLEMDLATGVATNTTTGETRQFRPVPDLIMEILNAGSALDWALTKVA